MRACFLRQKSFTPVWRFNQLLSGFLAKGHLPRLSCQSRLSANDKSDNDMIQEAVQRSLALVQFDAMTGRTVFIRRSPS